MIFPKKYALVFLKFLGIVGLTILALIALSCSKVNAQVMTYGPPPATTQKSMVQQKTHWFPGGVCYIERFIRSPEAVTFVTATAEHLQVKNIKSCVAKVKKLRWLDVGTNVPVPTYDSFREARTANMACIISSTLNTPLTYQVRFAAISLNGKGEELNDCMARAARSQDKAKLPPRSPAFQPSGYPPPQPIV